MNGQDIDKILHILLRHPNLKFLGVFSSDEIPNPTTYPSCCVINLDPRYLPGSHWVAVYFSSPNLIEFFDSYGNAPSIYNLPLPKTPHILFNPYPLQKINSKVCGHYCIFYLYHRAKGSSLQKISSHLRQIKSDMYVRSYIQKLVSLSSIKLP